MLKRIISLSFLVFTIVILQAQTEVTVSTGAGNGTQTWYNLATDAVTQSELTSWDLGFEISGFTASILSNAAKGNVLYTYPAAVATEANFLAIDTTGLSTWTAVYNSDTSWSYGAFNQFPEDEFDLGWGVYDVATHIITGDSMYVLKLTDGTYKKLWMQTLASGSYNFRYANLDNTGDVSASLLKDDFTGKNFGYYSFATDAQTDIEPASADWDLLFTKYTTFISMPELTPYSVAGVLSNYGVTIAKAEGVDVTSDEYEGYSFETEINTIGYDWKEYDFTSGSYLIEGDLAYFIAKPSGEIWKLVLTAFGGSSTGDITFTKEELTTVTIHQNDEHFSLAVYPNITASETVNIIFTNTQTMENMQVTVLQYNGKVMSTETFQNITSGLHQQHIDVSAFPAGMYLITLSANGYEATQKLIIQ